MVQIIIMIVDMVQIIILICFAAAGVVMVVVGIVRAIVIKNKDLEGRAIVWLLLVSGIALMGLVYMAVNQITGGLHG